MAQGARDVLNRLLYRAGGVIFVQPSARKTAAVETSGYLRYRRPAVFRSPIVPMGLFDVRPEAWNKVGVTRIDRKILATNPTVEGG